MVPSSFFRIFDDAILLAMCDLVVKKHFRYVKLKFFNHDF